MYLEPYAIIEAQCRLFLWILQLRAINYFCCCSFVNQDEKQ